jgi:uncharacterized membrane protein
MNRDEFMAQLARLLVNLPESERMEAIRYYNDYFDEAGPENESKVIQKLGSPGKVAAGIMSDLQDAAYINAEAGSQITSGQANQGAGQPGSDTSGQESQGAGQLGADTSGQGSQEAGQPGADTFGQGSQGAGQPGADTSGQGSQEAGQPGADTSGQASQGAGQQYNPGGQGTGTWQNANTNQWQNRQPGYNTRPRRNSQGAGRWVLIVIVLIFASPVILGVGGGLLGALVGVLGVAFGIIISCIAAGAGLLIGGGVLMVKGTVLLFHNPATGLLGLGGGLIAIALGILCMFLFVWIAFKLLPRIFRAVVNFISRIIHKSRGEAEQ